MSNSNAIHTMPKQTWRIFKRKKAILNTCALALVISANALISGNAMAENVAANALPTGGTFVGGAGNIGVNGNTMNINQSTQNAVINFDGFNVGSQAAVNVANGSGATLGRVTGSGTSYIDGQVNASGSLYLINRNGVVVGNTGVITTGGNFAAATTDVDTNAFMNSGSFNPSGAAYAPIANLGTIKSGRGNVTLYGSSVLNKGKIEATNGKISLQANGNDTPASMRKLLGDSEYENTYVQTDAQITNTGELKAAQVDLEARGNNIFSYAINNSGRIRANGVDTLPNGKVVLTSEGGNVLVSGEVSAQNADGSGGQVNIGGGYQGKDAAIANAATTTITETAKIDVSGSGNKDGGTAIVWSDNKTIMNGKIAANSGNTGGKGGFVEVSGKNSLKIATLKNISTKGVEASGELLLDPKNIRVVNSSAANLPADTDDTFYVSDEDIEYTLNHSGTVILRSSSAQAAGNGDGDIFLDNGVSIVWADNVDPITNAPISSSFVLRADRDININNVNIDGSGTTRGAVDFRAGRNINFSGDNTIASGKIDATYLYASNGNWQNGIGTINFDPAGQTDLIAKSIYLKSGKTAGNVRTDLVEATPVTFTSNGDTYGTIDIRGFGNVDIASGSAEPITADNYLKVYASNIRVASDLKLGGDLHLIGAAFDNATNNFSTKTDDAILNSDTNTDRSGEYASGWNSNAGTVTFDTAAKGGLINITSCCELIIKSGTSASGRTSLTSNNVNFSYTANNNKYKLVDIAGFDTFETNFQNNNLTAIEYVKFRNVNNVIRDNINSQNVLSWSTHDTLIQGATIGGFDKTANAATANAKSVAIVVDDATPLSAGQYGLVMDGASNINADKVAIYSSTQGQTSIAGKINGQNFVKGQEFTNNANETWTGFYRNDAGATFSTGNGINPFMVYYKNTQPATTNTVSGSSDCQVNPSAPGCATFVQLLTERVEYRIARTTFGSKVQQAVDSGEYLAASNSGMNLPNETFTKTGPTYMDDSLYTLTEKLGTAAYALPLQVVENVVGGTVAAIPGIQGLANKENFQTIPGAVVELARIPSTLLVSTPTILANIFGGTIGAVGNVVGGVGGAVGNVFTNGSNTGNPIVQ